MKKMLETDRNAFAYFDLVLRGLAFFHFMNLLGWKYYLHDPEHLFKLPVFPFLESTPSMVHYIIFSMYMLFTFLFIFRKNNTIFAFGLSLCFLYFEIHDKFSFHQDIFLAINIYFLFGMCKLSLDRNIAYAFLDYAFAIKILACIVYFFAGLHKLNSFFYTGILINHILKNGILKYFPLNESVVFTFAQFLSYFTIFGELSIPFLIWTRFKWIALLLGCSLSFGISLFGSRGVLFNSYLPLILILFFQFDPFACKLQDKYYQLVKRFDVLGL